MGFEGALYFSLCACGSCMFVFCFAIVWFADVSSLFCRCLVFCLLCLVKLVCC